MFENLVSIILKIEIPLFQEILFFVIYITLKQQRKMKSKII